MMRPLVKELQDHPKIIVKIVNGVLNMISTELIVIGKSFFSHELRCFAPLKHTTRAFGMQVLCLVLECRYTCLQTCRVRRTKSQASCNP